MRKLLTIAIFLCTCRSSSKHWVIETAVNVDGATNMKGVDSVLDMFKKGFIKVGDTVQINKGFYHVTVDTIPYEGSVKKYNDSVDNARKK